MLYASDVKIDPTLSGALSGAGNTAYSTINSNYAKAKGQLGKDASARGMNATKATGAGSYAADQFGAKQGLDTGNLESVLGGGLGSTAYNDKLQQRDYEENLALVEQAAKLNKPDLLQQILSGVGGAGRTGAQIYGAFGGGGSFGGGTGGGGAYNMMQPGPLDLGYSWGGR